MGVKATVGEKLGFVWILLPVSHRPGRRGAVCGRDEPLKLGMRAGPAHPGALMAAGSAGRELGWWERRRYIIIPR